MSGSGADGASWAAAAAAAVAAALLIDCRHATSLNVAFCPDTNRALTAIRSSSAESTQEVNKSIRFPNWRSSAKICPAFLTADHLLTAHIHSVRMDGKPEVRKIRCLSAGDLPLIRLWRSSEI